jgi:hypothetical protein
MIIKEFPSVEQCMKNLQEVNSLDNTARVFLALAKCFEHPKENSFDLGHLLKIDGEYVEFALDLINIYFHKDTYLISQPSHSYVIDDLINQKEFAQRLSANGFKYDQAKMAVYYSRGKLPAERVKIAGIPFWNEYDVQQYTEELKGKQEIIDKWKG